MVKVDVACMAHGLEARSPLLDHLLLEWAVAIPDGIKIAHGVTKALFKSAMRPYLPAKLLYRRKMGFSCPVDYWFRSELKELAYARCFRNERGIGAFSDRTTSTVCSTNIAARPLTIIQGSGHLDA